MKQLNHKNIIKLLDIKKTELGIYIFIPYYKYGDLFDFLQSGYIMSIRETKVIIKQIIDALKYIDDMGYVYPDLSLENIVIENIGSKNNPSEWKVVLIDLGSTMKKDDFLLTKVNYLPGKTSYRPPDYKYYFIQKRKIDILDSYVYTLGILMYILTTGKPPYLEPINTDPWFVVIISGEWLKRSMVKNIDKNFLLLIDQCVKYPWERITMEDLCLLL